MIPRIHWTAAHDAQLRRLRAEGATWDTIAHTLGVSRFTAIERGRRIGAPRLPPGPRPVTEDPARDPLPSGHPRSWGPLTAASVLEGVRYPFPVFL